jgi:hypothetical protein
MVRRAELDDVRGALNLPLALKNRILLGDRASAIADFVERFLHRCYHICLGRLAFLNVYFCHNRPRLTEGVNSRT